MSSQEHPLREALRSADAGCHPMISHDVAIARLSRLVEAGIAWEDAWNKESVEMDEIEKCADALSDAIRCEGETT